MDAANQPAGYGSPALSRSGLRTSVRAVLARHLDLKLYRVFLFGSEAAGTSLPGSDIDIGIWGPAPVPGAVLARINEELESLRTLRLFDIVDFSRVDETFRDVALQQSEPL